MRIGALLLAPAVLGSFAAMPLSEPALAQSAGQACIQQGHKPGTAGFYRCLQEVGGSEGGGEGGGEGQSGEAESILGGSPDNAVTDYTGSTMSGATSPDPNILKQLNAPRSPK
jgi:hypothetical protein